jgi:F0F1-type ATP synthase membrane subunit b/b'
MYKHLKEFNKKNKQLNGLKENSNKWLNEIRKVMQGMKEELNRDIELLKKNQLEILEMKSSITQI